MVFFRTTGTTSIAAKSDLSPSACALFLASGLHPLILTIEPMSNPTVFLLGATGYIGSEFLVSLGKTYSHLPVRALVRVPSDEKRSWLHAVHSNLTIIEGTLDNVETIEKEAEEADIVMNIASCDHVPSAQGTF